ncbi:hypothetical protein ACFQ0T_02360 [Kitasatospora gansuensis]
MVNAESPAAPDVRALLTGCGRLTGAEWAEQVDAGRKAGRTMAEQLVRSGRVTAGELQLCQLTAVLDAAYVVLSRSEGEIGFAPAPAPMFALARPMTARELRAAVGRRRTLLDRVWPSPQLDSAALHRRPAACRAAAPGAAGPYWRPPTAGTPPRSPCCWGDRRSAPCWTSGTWRPGD